LRHCTNPDSVLSEVMQGAVNSITGICSVRKSDLIFLEDHIKSCVNCSQYQEILKQIKYYVRDYLNTDLKPKPEIKASILKEYKHFQKEKNINLRSFREKFKNILGYRIPVYQAVVGTAFAVIIFFTAIELNHSITSPPNFPTNSEIYADTTYQGQLNIIKDIQILKKRNIGRTFQEDSVLTRFIVKLL